MSTSPEVSAAEVSAAAASDAYKDRPRGDSDDRPVLLAGKQYKVFGYKDNPETGFHATAYREVASPHNIIIAYRGTDPDITGHTRTTLQDAGVDFTMVKSRVNTQEKDANDFTQAMIKKAEDNGTHKDHVTVAGHSLGGTLAEIEAAKFGLHGATYNAYGAVDLNYKVPEGGSQITNYVMAGDVVSAGSHHFGEVKVLASQDDIQRLHSGRYLDAPAGSPPPNPLLAMSLSDHSVTHFTGEGGQVNVLSDANMPKYAALYEQNHAAIDHYRNDVHSDRAELGEALRQASSRNIETTLGNMSPRLQQQLLELHGAWVDAPIQNALEHNRVIGGVEHGLDRTAAGLRTGGEHAQQGADHFSQNARTAGQTVQRHADEVVRAGMGYTAIDPMAGAGLALGAKVAGYTARADAEIIAQASHLAGKATHVATQLAAEQAQAAKHVVEQGAHIASQTAKNATHVAEATVVLGVDGVTNAVHTVKAGVEKVDAAAHQAYRATEHVVNQAYDASRQAVSRGVDATERSLHNAGAAINKEASQAYDTLTHPGSWLDSKPTTPVHAGHAVQAAAPAPAHAPDDPRNPNNPKHALYEKVREQVASAYGKHGLSLNPEQLERTTAGVMLDAQKRQLKDIKEIHLNPAPGSQRVDSNSHVLAFSGDRANVTSFKSLTDAQQAQQRSPEQTYHQLGQVQQQQAQAHTQAQAQAHTPATPTVSGR